MANKPQEEQKKPASLDQIRSKDDITLANVYALGLEHDLENLEPENNPTERKRMQKSRQKDSQA